MVGGKRHSFKRCASGPTALTGLSTIQDVTTNVILIQMYAEGIIKIEIGTSNFLNLERG